MDLEGEAHALGVEDVDDRPPALGEVLVAALDLAPVVGRERVEHVPDGRAGEAGDDRRAELRRRARGVLHPLGRAAAHALGVAVAPDLRRQHALVAGVDRIAHRLADEVGAQRPAAQSVAFEQLAPAARVLGLGQRAVDLEVVPPARELQPVVAPRRALARQLLERKVRPLPGEQRDRSGHVSPRSWDDVRPRL
jgi:hypothetical protein